METLAILLAENPLFKGLDPQFLTALTECASNATFEPGHMIFRQGEVADRFYVLRERTASLEWFRLEPGSIPLQTMQGGDILGWSWLVPPHKWRFDARCVTRVRAFALDAACLRDILQKDPRLGYALLERFAMLLEQRLQATRLQLLDMYQTRA